MSVEKQKPKNERNNALMADIQEQIWQQNAILKREYRNRQMEKQKEEVTLKLSLWKRKNERYAKIREANKKERLDKEKKQVKKLQQKKKTK